MGKAQRKKLQRTAAETQTQVKTQRKTPHLLICAFLILINLVIYLQATGFTFSRLDDSMYVTDNSHVKAGLTATSIKWAFTAAHAGNWHPLTWLSHMLDIQLFGMNAGMHHMTGLTLHILNTLLLFFVLLRLTGYTWRSAFVAALFAVHPQHVESVAWVAERKDVLSTFFFMLTILAYAKYAQKPNIKRYLLVMLSFGLGLMAKPMLVSLPIVLLILDFWPLKRMKILSPSPQPSPSRGEGISVGKLLLEKLPLLIMTAISCKLTIWAQGSSQAIGTLEQLSVGIRSANAVMSYVVYLVKMLWPVKLAAFYIHPADTWPQWQVIGSAAILVAITAAAIALIRRAPYLLAGWLWYVITLIPVIGLMQVGSQGRADRYTYIPLIGIFMIIAWAAGDYLLKNPENVGRQRAAFTAALLIIIALMVPAYVQASYWRTSAATYSHAIAVTENNWFAENGYGGALKDKGQEDEAIVHFNKALSINPYLTPAYNSIGVLLTRKNKPEKAIEYYKEAIKRGLGCAEIYDNYATALALHGDLEQAIGYFKKAISHNMESAITHYNMALAYSRLGKLDEAIEEYKKSAEINPNQPVCYNNLGIILAQKNRLSESMQAFSDALKADPSFTAAQRNLDLVRSVMQKQK